MKSLLRALTSLLAISLCLSLAACSHKASRQSESTGPTVSVPKFSIAVKLSPAADERLRKLGESIKVIAYFDGDPLPGQGKYNPPMRDVYLGMAERLVDSKNELRFDDVKIPQCDWNRLADKNYFVTINAVSARNVYRDNLLDCDNPISGRIAAMQDKTTDVRCSLIGEAEANTK